MASNGAVTAPAANGAGLASGKSSQTAAIKLFWLNKSRSQRILWLLEECNLQYDIQIYHRNPKTMLAPPELKEVHPLGKSPVVTVTAPGADKPLVLAESAFIIEYTCKYYGSHLVPKEFKKGMEGQVGGETEEWLRYRFFMHYAEGSLMTILLAALLTNNIRTSPVPFFIRPITNMIASKISTSFLEPNFKSHFGFLESQLATSPGGGDYLCGTQLTAADILMSFPLEAAKGRAGLTEEAYPKLCKYVERLQGLDGYKRAIAKIVEMEGKYEPNL